MLRVACRRFRANFAEWAEDDHRASCAACAVWASAMERAAVRLPLPVSLRRALGSIPAIPAIEVQEEVPGPRRVPSLPVPDSLHERLRAIAGPARVVRPLPAWLRNSRHAVAASVLISLLAVRILGDPLAVGHRVVDSAAVQWHGLESRVAATYGTTRSSFALSLTDLGSRVTSIQASMRALIPESIPSSFRRLR